MDATILTEAVTFVIRYTPTIDSRPDIERETARALWYDAMTREADDLAERHGCKVEIHYEDILSS